MKQGSNIQIHHSNIFVTLDCFNRVIVIYSSQKDMVIGIGDFPIAKQ